MAIAQDGDVVVTELLDLGVSPDGSYAEMKLKNSDGSIQMLRFSPTTMQLFVNRVFQVFQNENLKKEEALGYAVVQPLEALTAMAQEAIGGKAVIIGFRLDTGLPVSFAVPPPEAEELHKQLGRAVKKAMRQFSQRRH
jgi:hypothetical protein